MSLPYVITILVTSGDPDGVRVVEKSNWTGSGMVFSRSDLASAVAQGLSSPGVYILMGEDPDESSEGLIYIGEAEDVGKRLGSHQKDDAKDFWTDTVAFTSKDAALNKAHIRYLESRLISLALTAKRVLLTNGTQPSPPPMSAADTAEAEGFLSEMLAIFPVLGISAFDTPSSKSTGRIRYFLNGPDAKGEGEERSDGFLVFAGASCRMEANKPLRPGFDRLRSKLITSRVLVEQDGVYVLTEDYLFNSPSTAATTLLSRTANGRIVWKDANGVTLKEHQIAAADSAGPAPYGAES